MKEVEAARITREIEDAVTHDYPGEGMPNGFGLGRMFIELPYAVQCKELNDRVNWMGLTPAEKDVVMSRVLADMREKVPEEIYPATWFDGVLLSTGATGKVIYLVKIRSRMETPDRCTNLDERVCSPERIRQRKKSTKSHN